MEYTRGQLVNEAVDLGYEGALDRTFKSWVGAGLLAKAHSPGRGRGPGRATGTWNDAQRQLWLDLLAGRRQGYRLRELANGPVWVWLMKGETAVPLVQVRQALRTWVGPPGNWGTHRGARALAKRALAEVDHPAAKPTDRKQLLDIAEHAAWYGKLDRDEFRAVAYAIAKHADRDPLDAQYRFDPDLLADLLDTRIRVLKTLDTIPDEWFERARLMNLGGLRWYQGEAERARREPRLAQYNPPIDWVERSLDSCNTLLSFLGLLVLNTTNPMPAIDDLISLAPPPPQAPNEGAPATAATARGHGAGTLEVPDATPP
jgi:hypothetical protein